MLTDTDASLAFEFFGNTPRFFNVVRPNEPSTSPLQKRPLSKSNLEDAQVEKEKGEKTKAEKRSKDELTRIADIMFGRVFIGELSARNSVFRAGSRLRASTGNARRSDDAIPKRAPVGSGAKLVIGSRKFSGGASATTGGFGPNLYFPLRRFGRKLSDSTTTDNRSEAEENVNMLSFLGSGPDRGRSHVERGYFPSVRPSVRPSPHTSRPEA